MLKFIYGLFLVSTVLASTALAEEHLNVLFMPEKIRAHDEPPEYRQSVPWRKRKLESFLPNIEHVTEDHRLADHVLSPGPQREIGQGQD